MVGASLKRLLENDQLVVGISELSDIVGVSPRQLRYWEQKGFIRSIEADANCPRKYRLPTVIKVELIKSRTIANTNTKPQVSSPTVS